MGAVFSFEIVSQSRCVGVRRRQVIAGLGSAAISGSAGCIGESTTITVLAAGSLPKAIESHLAPAFTDETNIGVHGEFFGTNALIRMVLDGTKQPDVIISADNALLRDRLYPEFTDWDVEFASNSLGIGYAPETSFGQALESDGLWYEHALDIAEGDISIGDPDLDPLGYRAIQAFQLAAREYGLEAFPERMLELVEIEPDEPQMMASVAAGNRAGSVVYRNMALDHDMPFFEFSDSYNFSDPDRNDHYATATYTTDEEGYTAEGRAVVYNATVPNTADEPTAGIEFIQFLIDNDDRIIDAGLTSPPALPNGYGAVPEEIHL